MTTKTITASEKFEALAGYFAEGKLGENASKAYLDAHAQATEAAAEDGWEEGDENFSQRFVEIYDTLYTPSDQVGDGLDAAIEAVNEELAKVEEKKEAPAKVEKPTHCTHEEGCDKPVYVKGLCRTHYEIFRTSDPSRPDCAHEGCDQKVYTKGLCRKHYVARRSTAAHAGLSADDREVLVEVVEALAKMRKGGGPLITQAREILGMPAPTESLPVVAPAE
jgi:hypothetical protein